jgi:thiol-disulfide isomerase/thioredoxin
MRPVMLLLLVIACGAPARVPPPPARTGPLALVEGAADLDGARIGRADPPATVLVVFASWCPHCRVELDILDKLRPRFAGMRIVGVNYVGHEEYKGRGDAAAVRAYVAEHAPWLRVVPADDLMYAALGYPAKIPTIYIYDRAGALVATFDRKQRAMPTSDELAAILARLGA